MPIPGRPDLPQLRFRALAFECQARSFAGYLRKLPGQQQDGISFLQGLGKPFFAAFGPFGVCCVQLRIEGFSTLKLVKGMLFSFKLVLLLFHICLFMPKIWRVVPLPGMN